MTDGICKLRNGRWASRRQSQDEILTEEFTFVTREEAVAAYIKWQRALNNTNIAPDQVPVYHQVERTHISYVRERA